MSRLFEEGDRVVRVPGDYDGRYVGEMATVVKSQIDDYDPVVIIFDNKSIRGDRTYISHSSCVQLFTPGDDYDID